MKKAIIYTRVSSNDQIENTSLQHQFEKCKTFAKLKDFKIVKHYSDEGFSGKNFNRPSFQLLIKEQDKFEIIICYSLDRFSRSTFELLKIIKEFKDLGKEIYFLNPMINTSDKYGEFFMTILSAIAQLERSMILERTRNGIKERFKQGKLQNRIPFGYNKNCTINKKQAKKVEEIFKYRIMNPKEPIIQIAKKFKMPNSSIHLILRNKFYIGHMKYKGKLKRDNHKAIISKRDFEKACEIFKNKKII